MMKDPYSWVWVLQPALLSPWIRIDILCHHFAWWSPLLCPLASTGSRKMKQESDSVTLDLDWRTVSSFCLMVSSFLSFCFNWKWKDEAGILILDLGLASGLLRMKHDSFAMYLFVPFYPFLSLDLLDHSSSTTLFISQYVRSVFGTKLPTNFIIHIVEHVPMDLVIFIIGVTTDCRTIINKLFFPHKSKIECHYHSSSLYPSICFSISTEGCKLYELLQTKKYLRITMGIGRGDSRFQGMLMFLWFGLLVQAAQFITMAQSKMVFSRKFEAQFVTARETLDPQNWWKLTGTKMMNGNEIHFLIYVERIIYL